MDHSQKAVDIFNANAQRYEEKFMDVQIYATGLNLFCQHLENQKAEILDIACGPGNMAQYLLKHNPEYQLMGIDLAPQMLDLAKKSNPLAQFMLMDARNITSLHKKFHGILAAFCMPYLNKTEALQLIADAAQLLHPEGMLYLSTMEDAYEQSRYHKSSAGDEMFIHYHQADYLTEAFIQHGFSIVYTHRINNIMGENLPITDLILVARKLA
jgi:2-polyprenyl-3-methyl-5-hydroxy-6-metoxy-1,4-benzoquinol methylase